MKSRDRQGNEKITWEKEVEWAIERIVDESKISI